MTNKKLILIILGVGFSLLFIYVFFPFSLLKDILISKAQAQLHAANIEAKIEAKSLSSYWITGLELKEVQIANQNSPNNILKIDKLIFRVSILPLLIGKVNIHNNLKIDIGEANIDFSLSLSKLISQEILINELNAEFTNFRIDEILSQLISLITNSNNSGLALITPVIINSSAGGLMNGVIEYKNVPHVPAIADLKINNAYMDINNAALGIPKQNFSVANISMVYADDLLTIKKDTNFKAQDLSISASGKIKQGINQPKDKSMNVNLQIKLSGKIESNFGFLLPQILKCPSNSIVEGVMNVQLVGELNSFKCTPS